MAAAQVHPEVFWAQRSSSSDAARNIIYLTIMAPDVHKSDFKLDLQPTKLTFTGKSATKNLTYHADFDFFAEIDPDKSKINHSDRDIELVLNKKDLNEEFWPRLLKDKAKVHWLKTDFDKWVDEDEQDPVAEDDDYMSKMGGMGGGMGGAPGGMPDMGALGGMGGMGGMGGGFEGIDFSKFGAGAGGLAGGEEEEEEEEDDDDEDMPGLESEEHAPAAAKTEKTDKAVIEEVE